MQVLLINPSVSIKHIYRNLATTGGLTLPQGIAYIAAYLEKGGHLVEVMDCMAEGMRDEDIIERVKKSNYKMIGIACLTPFAVASFHTANLVKKHSPSSTVILGGPHASIHPEKSLIECEGADIVVIGEGERTTLELVNAIELHKDLRSVKGIMFREKGAVISTERRQLIEDLNELPIPAYHLFNMDVYKPTIMKYRRLPTYAVIATRGCPFLCTFCCRPIHGKKIRLRPVDHVMKELMLLRDKYNAKGIIFQDSSIALNKKWLMALCAAMIESKYGVEWACLARIDQIDAELLKRMKQAGCWQICYGIESGNQKSLDFIKKGYTIPQIREVCRETWEAGIQIRSSFMLGIPGENREDILNTIRFARELNTMFPTFFLTVPFPNTELYDSIRPEHGEFRVSASWDDFNPLNRKQPVFIPKGMTKEELEKLVRHAWLTCYLSPKFLLRHLFSIRSLHDIRRYTKGLFGIFMSSSNKLSGVD